MDKGTIYLPKTTKGLEVHVDADFVGNWDKEDLENTDNARSRHGIVISYKVCPIVWKAFLQTEIALSIIEIEYTGLSYSQKEKIPIMRIFKEISSIVFT